MNKVGMQRLTPMVDVAGGLFHADVQLCTHLPKEVNYVAARDVQVLDCSIPRYAEGVNAISGSLDLHKSACSSCLSAHCCFRYLSITRFHAIGTQQFGTTVFTCRVRPLNRYVVIRL